MESGYIGEWGKMKNDKRLEVRLPGDLLEQLDQAVIVLDADRSDLVRRAVHNIVRRARDKAEQLGINWGK